MTQVIGLLGQQLLAAKCCGVGLKASLKTKETKETQLVGAFIFALGMNYLS